MIGSFAGISFSVSESRVQTFSEMTRETASRWNTHEVIGAKPKQDISGTGPGQHELFDDAFRLAGR